MRMLHYIDGENRKEKLPVPWGLSEDKPQHYRVHGVVVHTASS